MYRCILLVYHPELSYIEIKYFGILKNLTNVGKNNMDLAVFTQKLSNKNTCWRSKNIITQRERETVDYL